MVRLADLHLILKGAALTMHDGAIIFHRVLLIYLKCDLSLCWSVIQWFMPRQRRVSTALVWLLDESYASIRLLFGTTQGCQGQDPISLFIDTLILESKRRYCLDRDRPGLLWTSTSSDVRHEHVFAPALWADVRRPTCLLQQLRVM